MARVNRGARISSDPLDGLTVHPNLGSMSLHFLLHDVEERKAISAGEVHPLAKYDLVYLPTASALYDCPRAKASGIEPNAWVHEKENAA